MSAANPFDSQILRTMMIPVHERLSLILPSSSVVQVLPYATPLRLENAPRWVVGAMLWRARSIPLVSPGLLLNPLDLDTTTHARIAVLNTVRQRPKLAHFGLLAGGAPHPLNLTRAAIDTDPDAEPAPEGVLCRVKVNGEAAAIPDMDYIEEALAQVMRA